MTFRTPCLAIAAAVMFALPGQFAAAEPPGLKTLEIGAEAPDFSLPGVDGKTYSLKDFADSKVLVVAFTCNHCPTAQAYEDRFAKFNAEYKPKGVAFVAISPNDPAAVRLDELGFTDLDDSFESMKIRAKDTKIAYPYLFDGDTQKTAIEYGVLATPHMYVFDADRKLRYVGRFDDSEVKTVKSHDLINAVDALLAGRTVPVEKTRTFGCSTKWSEKRADAVKSLAKWDAEPVEMKEITDADLAKLVKNDTKNYLVINLWATWCGPCLAELPELVTINRMYRGRPFKMITISMNAPDKADEALKALKENKVAMTNYIAKSEHIDKFAAILDKEWPGPLPYTIIIAPGGEIIYRKVDRVEPLDLKRAIVSKIGRTY